MEKYLIENLKDGVHISLECENDILGIIILEPTLLSQVYSILKPDFFYNEFNKALYLGIKNLFENGKAIDMLTISIEMKRTYQNKEKVNISYEIAEKTKRVVTSANFLEWCYCLYEIYTNRETFLIRSGYYKGESESETAQIIKEKLDGLFVKNINDWSDASFVANELVSHIEHIEKYGNEGIKSGLSLIDSITGGAKPEQLIVVGARPGVGKSALLNKWTNEALKQNKAVGIINLEMPDKNTMARMLSNESGVRFSNIYNANFINEEERKFVINELLKLSNQKLNFCSQAGIDAYSIRAKAVQLKNRNLLDILFIDYLQLVSGTGKKNNRQEEVAELTRNLKLLAKELKIPIVALCQLNRDSTKASGEKKPKISQARESGAIEQDADIVILLHREEDENEEKVNENAEIKIGKNRNGKTSKWLPITFDGSKVLFKDFEPSYTPIIPEHIEKTSFNNGLQNETPF